MFYRNVKYFLKNALILTLLPLLRLAMMSRLHYSSAPAWHLTLAPATNDRHLCCVCFLLALVFQLRCFSLSASSCDREVFTDRDAVNVMEMIVSVVLWFIILPSWSRSQLWLLFWVIAWCSRRDQPQLFTSLKSIPNHVRYERQLEPLGRALLCESHLLALPLLPAVIIMML